MPEFRAWRTCEACEHSANEPDVQPSLAKLPDVLDGRGRIVTAGAYLDVIRCKDVEACRKRTAERGRSWPFESTRWDSLRRDDR